MKKILSTIILSLFILWTGLTQVSAYNISKEKQDLIQKSLPTNIITKVDNIVSKWNEEKTYLIYKKIKKLVFQLQMKVLKSTNKTNEEKKQLINKFYAILYLIEEHVDKKYEPSNWSNDSI